MDHVEHEKMCSRCDGDVREANVANYEQMDMWGEGNCSNRQRENGYEGWCDLFLRPPWQSTFIDVLMTNFHLPGSSLLLLVAGFLGDDGEGKIRKIYNEAIREKYRFYSFGDAMLII